MFQVTSNYSCIAQDQAVKNEKTIVVTVIDRSKIMTCSNDTFFEVDWMETAPGSEDIQLCPQNYEGLARRACIMKDRNVAEWEIPDMSDCMSREMEFIVKRVSGSTKKCSVLN